MDGLSFLYQCGRYFIRCVVQCTCAFRVGLIRLRSTPLPKLQGLEYVLNVTATDDNVSGGPHSLSSTARVIVGVDDVNNNKPVFEEVRNKSLYSAVLCSVLESVFLK